VALRIFEIIERDKLEDHVRSLGDWLKAELQRLVDDHPSVLRAVRGLGFMLGVELLPKADIPTLAASDKPAATQLVLRLHEAGVLTIPAGPQVFRLLPPLNMARSEAEDGLAVIEKVIKSVVP
jgi:4-aminobutyrate aminotransferase-like enzyme